MLIQRDTSGVQAACLLKLREPRKAVAKCTSVLELQPGNSKAFYRKALGESAQGPGVPFCGFINVVDSTAWWCSDSFGVVLVGLAGNFEGARNDLRAGMQFASDVRIFEAELVRFAYCCVVVLGNSFCPDDHCGCLWLPPLATCG